MMPFQNHLRLEHRLLVRARVTFASGWRVGTGREGGGGSDLGVLRDPQGRPLLPGTSIRGKLRAGCEALAYAFGMTACCLDHAASGVSCVSDTRYFRSVSDQYSRLTDFPERMNWLSQHICDVCQLFGSPLCAARLRVSEGRYVEGTPDSVGVRDSVVLDRDSHTAVDGLKYDYEVTQPGTSFDMEIEADNASDREIALLGAGLLDWSAGVSLGGFTTRGLGRADFRIQDIREVRLTDPQQRLTWLKEVDGNKRYQEVNEPWQSFFETYINATHDASSGVPAN